MSLEEEHELVMKPMGTASYDRTKKTWRVSKQKYLKQKCASCKREIRLIVHVIRVCQCIIHALQSIWWM